VVAVVFFFPSNTSVSNLVHYERQEEAQALRDLVKQRGSALEGWHGRCENLGLRSEPQIELNKEPLAVRPPTPRFSVSLQPDIKMD
jgi:hypothetical protein